MSEFQLGNTPFSHAPVHPEQQFSIEHQVPYIWGNLYITEEAQAAYGFTPLTVGNDTYDKTSSYRIDVAVVAPTELEKPANPVESDRDSVTFQSGWHFHDHGIEVVTGFTKTAEQLGQDMLEKTDEETESRASQALAHTMCDGLSSQLPKYIADWREVTTNKEFYRRVKQSGRGALAGAAVASIPGIILGLEGTVSYPNLVLPLVLIAGEAAISRRALGNFIKREYARRNSSTTIAAIQADTVVNDIHRSLCRDQFNREMHRRFAE